MLRPSDGFVSQPIAVMPMRRELYIDGLDGLPKD